ncbi:MAG: threonine synthase [Bacteroidota bacterium]
MQFFSLNNPTHKTSFKEAVVQGIAPDKGLYFPERIDPLPTQFFEQLSSLSHREIAFTAIKQFVADDIPDEVLTAIVSATLDFDFPVVKIEPQVATLELFHGPTMAFKDVGARFMANCLGYFSQDQEEEVTVLVATSGDTGGAVANGFLGVPGVKVVILYPSGKVSHIQEQQLTTLGQNITALEVEGTFDDCQRMVKRAFLDSELTDHKKLTSANSINVARWLPQLFYYLFAQKQQPKGEKLIFSVPSGNFGNICAGMVAHRLGMPAEHFVAATNVNDVVPEYMRTGNYQAKRSVSTISNAMDVGDPSNFVRIQELYDTDFEKLSQSFSAYSFTDAETRVAMKELHDNTGYVADPHGAVGYLGLKKYLNQHGGRGVFLETAHPVKFLPVVEEVLGLTPDIPPQIQAVMDRKKTAVPISDYENFKTFLLKN